MTAVNQDTSVSTRRELNGGLQPLGNGKLGLLKLKNSEYRGFASTASKHNLPAETSAEPQPVNKLPRKSSSGNLERFPPSESLQQGSKQESMKDFENKRRAQNRVAQRAFRERKVKHLKDLETRVCELEYEAGNYKSINIALRSKLSALEEELQRYRASILTPSIAAVPLKPAAPENFSHKYQNGIETPFVSPSGVPVPGALLGIPTPNSMIGTDAAVVDAAGLAQLSHKVPWGAQRAPQTHDPIESSKYSFDVGMNLPTSGLVGHCLNVNPDYGGQENGVSPAGTHTSSGSAETRGSNLCPMLSATCDSLSDSPNSNPTPTRVDEFCDQLSQACLQKPSLELPVAPPLAADTSGWNDHIQNSHGLDFSFGFRDIAKNDEDTQDITDFMNSEYGLFDPLDDELGDWKEVVAACEQLDAEQPQPAHKQASGTSGNLEVPGASAYSGTSATGRADSDEQVPASNTKFMSCSDVWDRICSHPKFSEIDINSICHELRTKAKCSDTGVVMSERDLDDVFNASLEGKSTN